MTQDFEHMLRLFGAGALGYEIDKIENINIEKIRSLAIEQGIWHTVYAYMVKQYDMSAYQKEFLATVTSALQRREYTLGIIAGLEKIGIKCCLIKGVVIAQLYAQPDCRVSGDTDILINPDDEERVKTYLIQKGYSVEKRGKINNHLVAHHPIGGLLEVHIKLHKITAEKLLFDDMQFEPEKYRKIVINNIEYTTLGIDDGLIFLSTHYIKHLIKDGGGIRQMMDLLIYMKRYKNEIDIEKYNNLLSELRYNKLIEVVKTIGAKYWEMPYEKVYEDLADRVLTDCENGGIFGYSTDDRVGFYEMYCAKRNGVLKANTILGSVSLFHTQRSMISKIFPNSDGMRERGYNDTDTFPKLVLAWIKRWCDIARRKKPDTSQRLKLMQDLNMID